MVSCCSQACLGLPSSCSTIDFLALPFFHSQVRQLPQHLQASCHRTCKPPNRVARPCGRSSLSLCRSSCLGSTRRPAALSPAVLGCPPTHRPRRVPPRASHLLAHSLAMWALLATAAAGLEAGHGLASILHHNAFMDTGLAEYTAGGGADGLLGRCHRRCSTSSAWGPASATWPTLATLVNPTIQSPPHQVEPPPNPTHATLAVFPKVSTTSATACSTLSAIATGASLLLGE